MSLTCDPRKPSCGVLHSSLCEVLMRLIHEILCGFLTYSYFIPIMSINLTVEKKELIIVQVCIYGFDWFDGNGNRF